MKKGQTLDQVKGEQQEQEALKQLEGGLAPKYQKKDSPEH